VDHRRRRTAPPLDHRQLPARHGLRGQVRRLDGKIEAYYNGELQTTVESDASEAYFKTGAYTQANCEKSDPCDESNYGEVVLYELNVEHRE